MVVPVGDVCHLPARLNDMNTVSGGGWWEVHAMCLLRLSLFPVLSWSG